MGLSRLQRLVETYSAPVCVHLIFFTLLIKKIRYHQSSPGGRRALSEGDTYYIDERTSHTTKCDSTPHFPPGQDICNVFGFRTIDNIKSHTH